jgi:hypothetical protein
MPEKILLSSDCNYLTVSGATGTQPLVTPNSGLVSQD